MPKQKDDYTKKEPLLGNLTCQLQRTVKSFQSFLLLKIKIHDLVQIVNTRHFKTWVKFW